MLRQRLKNQASLRGETVDYSGFAKDPDALSKPDEKALAELDLNLRMLDPKDPVKYDFALFGLGVFEGF